MSVNFYCFIGALLLGLATSALAEENKFHYTDQRLPTNVRPINYNLTLVIDKEKDTFQGFVGVQLHVTKPTSYIVINARDLKFGKAYLRSFEKKQEEDIILDHSMLNYCILKFTHSIEPGIYFLGIEYMANYVDRHSYNIGILKHDRFDFLITKTGGNELRAILPCFDEPALKATFDLTIIQTHMDGYHSLSVMDIKEVIEDGSSRITIFNRTPPMSPNFFGFLITKQSSHRSVTVYQEGVGEPFELRLYAQSLEEEYVDPSLNYIKEALEFFANYTNVAYPLPKLDFVVIGSDSQRFLVKSWGLIVIEQDNTNLGRPLKLYREREIMSLLAGIWFGNLVISNWCGGVWPTSDISKLMGWKALTALAPNLTEIIDFNILNDIQLSMTPWLTGYSDPLQNVDYSVYSSVSLRCEYSKGFGPLMMTESVVGQDNFRMALSSFLKKHMYGTVTTSDLIEEMQAVYPDAALTRMMKSVAENFKYPIVTLEKLEDGSYKLKQETFIGHGDNYDSYAGIWTTPVHIKTVNTSKLVWLKGSEYIIPDFEADWAVISVRGYGYYLVAYNDNLWLALANVLQRDKEVLSSLERIKLLYSLRFQIENKHLNYDVAFEVLRFLEKETSMAIWNVALKVLSGVRMAFRGKALRGFMKYGQELIKRYYQTINWTKDILDEYHYQKVFNFACECELENCLVFAKTLLPSIDVVQTRFFNDKERVIATAGLKRTTDPDVWEKYWKAFDKDPGQGRFSILMTHKDPEFLKKVVDRATSISYMHFQSPSEVSVDPQQIWSLLKNELAKNETTRQFDVYLEILKKEVEPDVFEAMYTSSEMEEFFKRLGYPTYYSSNLYYVKEVAEKMATATKWLKENGFMKSSWLLITL